MLVTDAFVRGMTEGGGYTAQTVHICGLKITPCIGCLSCWGRTEGKCVLQGDDMEWVRQAIREADVIIASFPMYLFGVPGQLKLFADRLLPMMSAYRGQFVPKDDSPAHPWRHDTSGQKCLLISGCAYVETREVYDPILKQCDLVLGRNRYTAILCPQLRTMIDNGGPRVRRTVEHFTAAGREFAESGTLSEKTMQQITRPPFSQPVYEQILESVWDGERKKGENGNDSSCH